METSRKQQKRSQPHRTSTNTSEQQKAPSTLASSSDPVTMAHYANYPQSTYGMPGYGQGIMTNPATGGRFTMEGMTEDEIYAMNQMTGSNMHFAGSYAPQYSDQHMNAASGYPQLQMSGYPNWEQAVSDPLPQAHGTVGTSSLAGAWAANSLPMQTPGVAEYNASVYGVSPTFSQSAGESSSTQQEGNFRCEVEGCGKLFTRSYNYKAHLETHDERREYPFHCTVSGCDKKFARKTDLQRHHQSVHMKERNHGCTFCGRFFARKDTLRRHMEDGCSKRFDIETIDLEHTFN
ncbi:hypothetical protein NLG97_g900 [Lecanicillium saksenae]|uniref:Uncharacterized protein n=1 Tax=Lecanicillium saksenae TaxID=468837 RepID=A0ACC1R583_9HYPO|nr:hypothetical protein NLG97_g900 [Lecanicillium saksenae]